ncbi:MAG: hypothetical protein R3B53_04575 [Candidatus Paceibacterota bacterium]
MTQLSQKVILNYSMSLADMLTACNMSAVDPIASEVVTDEYFPSKAREWLQCRSWKDLGEKWLYRADRARSILMEKGLRPATLPEMLMFMVNNPEEATNHAIVALSPATISPVGRFKNWYMEYRRSFVPTIINHTRFHNGARLERVGKPEIWLAPEMIAGFAVIPV